MIELEWLWVILFLLVLGYNVGVWHEKYRARAEARRTWAQIQRAIEESARAVHEEELARLREAEAKRYSEGVRF